MNTWLEIPAIGEEISSQIFELQEAKVEVGRSVPDDALRIGGDGVSRHHINFLRLGDGYEVVDCESTNGFLVNGVHYLKCPLLDGDRIRLGKKRTLIFRKPGEGFGIAPGKPIPPPEPCLEGTESIDPPSADGGLFPDALAWATRASQLLRSLGTPVKKQALGSALQLITTCPSMGVRGISVHSHRWGATFTNGSVGKKLPAPDIGDRLKETAGSGQNTWISRKRVSRQRDATRRSEAAVFSAGNGNALYIEAETELSERAIAAALFIASQLAALLPRQKPDTTTKDRLAGGHLVLGGTSSHAVALHRAAQKAAPLTTPLIIQGADGAGKTYLARVIHEATGSTSPLVITNCRATPAEKLGLQLFGTTDTPGALETHSGGTIVLDDITDLPAELQPLLYRCLVDQTITTIDGTTSMVGAAPARVIALSNTPLETAVSNGQFRSDLAALFAATISVSGLEKRREDIPALARVFLAQLGPEYADQEPRGLLAALEKRPWTGHVRELRSAVSHAVQEARSQGLRMPTAQCLPEPLQPSAFIGDGDPGTSATMEAIKRWHITRVVDSCGGNKKKASEILDISRGYVSGKLKSDTTL